MSLKFKLLIVLISLINNLCLAQISISDKSDRPKIKAIPYDGSFKDFDSKSSISKEQMAGVVGEKITLIDAYLFLKKEDGKNVDFSLSESFNNKTFKVIEYLDDVFPKLKINNELGTYILDASVGAEYVFDKYIETVRNKLLNKIFVPLYNESPIQSLDGKKFKILGSREYKITNVSFAKLERGYGIVLKVNDDFECIYGDDKYSILEKNWIEFTGTDLLSSAVKLLEKSEFQKFVAQNKSFIKDIRSGQVRVGMTETQCRYAFGIPSRVFIINGFKILDYGNKNISLSLHFKNNKLNFIKN